MVELVTALKQAHRESPSWRLYGLCHQAAARIAELEAENARLEGQRTLALQADVDRFQAEALSRTGAVKVTDEMVEAVVEAIRPYTRGTLFLDEHQILVRAALMAAMEAGRHD